MAVTVNCPHSVRRSLHGVSARSLPRPSIRGPCLAPSGREPRSRQYTVAQATLSIDSIDRHEYVSGQRVSTVLGRIIQAILPAPVRFIVCWLPPLLTIASCHALTVMSTIGKVASATQTALPCLEPILQLGTTTAFLRIATVAMHMLPVLFAFVLVPILDYLLGEEEAQALDSPATAWQTALYKAVCYVFSALHITALASATVVASQPSTSWPVLVLLAVNCAVSGGYAFTVAHELIHSRSKADRMLGQVLLTSNCYKHWGHSHMAHHAQVATPKDPASARYREAVYPFVFRCISGEWRDAVKLERKRMERDMPGAPYWQQLLRSSIPGWILWPAALAASTYAVLGLKALALFALSATGSIFFLTVINYVEHYGLTRTLLATGKPVPVAPTHSWNANHLVSNASLLRLQRHTDHHMNSYKPFYRLENVEGAPRLPGDYSTMLLLALVPPLWFCIMNPRVHLYKLLSDVRGKEGGPSGGQVGVGSPSPDAGGQAGR